MRKKRQVKNMCLILPSVELSQKHVFAVCSPAPFFCMIIQLTVENVQVQINFSVLLTEAYRWSGCGY